MSAPEKAISIRAPWWWFVLHAGKDLENRDRRWHYRGPILLHASKWFGNREVDETFKDVYCRLRELGRAPDINPPSPAVSLRTLREACGCIVGRATVVDCITSSSSFWFCGPFALVLRDVVPLATPIPFKGALGLFDVPAGLVP